MKARTEDYEAEALMCYQENVWESKPYAINKIVKPWNAAEMNKEIFVGVVSFSHSRETGKFHPDIYLPGFTTHYSIDKESGLEEEQCNGIKAVEIFVDWVNAIEREKKAGRT